jgi:hypothetical protein
MNAAWVSSNEERLASSMTVNEATAAFFDIENIAGAAPAAFYLNTTSFVKTRGSVVIHANAPA